MNVLTYGQSKGTVSGTIRDKALDLEPVAFASVYVKGQTGIGTTSDFDGVYALTLDAGTYTLVFQFVGYNTINKEVTITSGETLKVDVVLEPQANVLDAVQLKAIKVKNTEKAMLEAQKEATVTMDAISVEAIKKSGASDVASAVKAVTGVSVEGGKYVVVRGLNDRYTKTLLNGAQIPGLDPDKNSVQLDIFPTGILDNISVIKSGSAEYPADFTGGVVDIITKTVTGKRISNISVGLGYNPDMNLKDNFLSYTGSSTDFFGFDNGDRDIPIPTYTDVPASSSDNSELRALTDAFQSELRAKTANSFLNFNFGVTYGNSVEIGSNKLGYLGSVAYSSKYTLYEDAIDQSLVRNPGTGELLEFETGRSEGVIGQQNTALTLLGGLFYDTDYSSYKLKVLHILNGESSAEFYNQEYYTNPGDFETDIATNALLYTERSFTNILLSGKHTNENDTWDLSWKISPTFSRADDLNHRITRFSVSTTGEYSIEGDQGGLPEQLWRLLDETNLDSKIDLVNYHTFLGNDSKLKFGGAYAWKQRDFSIATYSFAVDNLDVPTDGDADFVLLDENLIDDSGVGTRLQSGIVDDSNTFDANQTTIAAYVSEEFKLFDKLKTILGVRAELFRSLYTGLDVNRTPQKDLEIINELDFFPSANLIYEVNDKFNIRSSYGRTTARPSFKEATAIAIQDPITDRIFNGNIELNPTYINNMDLRFEYYGDEGAFYAVSGFYKSFTDPIELTFYQAAPTQLQPNNLGDAIAYGFELESRLPLNFIVEGLSFNANYSLIKSELNMFSEEYRSRYGDIASGVTVTQEILDSGIENGAAILGETTSNTRSLQGQSPHVLNAGISYKNEDKYFNTALTYNVQGETLEVVGTGFIPDVYTQPFHALNLTASKSFGEEQKHKLNFRATNILGDEKESVYSAYGVSDEAYKVRQPGRTFSLSYSFNF